MAPVKAIAGLVLGLVTGAAAGATTGGAVVGVVAGAVAGAAVTEVVTVSVGHVVGVVACALLAVTSAGGEPQLGPVQFAVLLTELPEVSEELSVTENVKV